MTAAREGRTNWPAIIIVLGITAIVFMWLQDQRAKKDCESRMDYARLVEDSRHNPWELGSDLDRDRAVAEYAEAIGC